MYGTQTLFFNISNDISSAAIASNSVQRDYLGLTTLTTDTTS